MKKKKIALFTPVIVLSFCMIFFSCLFSVKIPNQQSQTDSPFILPPVFSLKDLIGKNQDSTNQTTLLAVGDIMLGRYCNVQMINNKEYKYPFLKTADITKSGDITFGNLETPIIENCPTTETGMLFCARPESIEGLKFAGFDVLSLTNNHILNYGQKGLDQTMNLLTKNQILPSADTLTSYKLQANQLKFGFLSFDLVSYPPPRLAVFGEAGQTVDILIVSLHWGNEYQKIPTESQKKLAHQIIDAGAKIIIGHHPHVTQPVEEYNGGLIFYSLGNFVFDQPWSEDTKKGEIAKIIFEGKEIKSYELIPVYIDNFCQPLVRN